MNYICSKITPILHVYGRLKYSQIFARAKIRYRQTLLKKYGLNRILPRKRNNLGEKWKGKLLGCKEIVKHSASQYDSILGFNYKANVEYLVSGYEGVNQYKRDLKRLEHCYHAFLLSSGLSVVEKVCLLEKYFEKHQVTISDSACEWHPYAVSNRLEKWILFLVEHIASLPESFAVKMANECLLLADYVDWMQEKDIEGNHWLKNLWILSICDCLLADYGTKCEISHNNYISELTKQILPDGGHYELSPMYHAKILNDVNTRLTVEGLSADNRNKLREIEVRMNNWLSIMTLAKGKWANFNDSWHIEHLGIKTLEEPDITSNASGVVYLKNSGFARLQNEKGWKAILDAGGVSPSFNPGHSHSDILSIIAYFNGLSVIADPGTMHYSPNDERVFLKSAFSHNGPCLTERDHTEIIGSFRIGKSANGQVANVNNSEENLSVSAEHTGFRTVRVSRHVFLSGFELNVTDQWNPIGNEVCTPRLRWLLCASINNIELFDVNKSSVKITFKKCHDSRVYCIQFIMSIQNGDAKLYAGESVYFDQYGRSEPCIEILFTGNKSESQYTVKTNIIASLA